MICRNGRIVRLTDGHASVAVSQTSDCARCQAGKGCGFSLLARWLVDTDSPLELTADEDLAVGQRVVVEMTPGALSRAVAATHGPLLVGLIGGIAIGQMAGSDLLALGGGLLGLLLGMLLPLPGRVPAVRVRPGENP